MCVRKGKEPHTSIPRCVDKRIAEDMEHQRERGNVKGQNCPKNSMLQIRQIQQPSIAEKHGHSVVMSPGYQICRLVGQVVPPREESFLTKSEDLFRAEGHHLSIGHGCLR